MLQGHHLDASGIGHIERGNDAAQALQVVSVVGNDQSVGARVHIDRVVGANERPQDRYQVVGTLVVELKNLRQNLSVGCGHSACRHTTTLQLGIGLGHDQIQTCRFHQGKTLCAQLSSKQTQCLCRRNRHRAGQGYGAFDARIDHHVVTRQRGQGFGHRFNFSIVEVEGDGLLCRLGRGAGVCFFVDLGCLRVDVAAQKGQGQADAQTDQQLRESLAMRR